MLTFKKSVITVAALAAVASASAAGPELLVNGGFETGDFSGWTLGGNPGFTGVTGNFSGVNPTEGSFQAFFGAVGSTTSLTQSQSFATSTGHLYRFSFDLANLGGPTNSFDASFNGASVYSLTDASPFGYSTHTFDILATGTSSNVMFSIRQDPSYYLLDNVSVRDISSVPGPAAMASFGFGMLARRRRKSTRSAARA